MYITSKHIFDWVDLWGDKVNMSTYFVTDTADIHKRGLGNMMSCILRTVC